jgi:hypothetical protein
MEPIGALRRDVVDANPLIDMVGPCGLEPQTSTVSSALQIGLSWTQLGLGISLLLFRKAQHSAKINF